MSGEIVHGFWGDMEGRHVEIYTECLEIIVNHRVNVIAISLGTWSLRATAQMGRVAETSLKVFTCF
jgi:hypothetical protein